MAKPDDKLPALRETSLTAPPHGGLRLARIGPVLTLALLGTVLLSAGLFTGALWLLGFPALTPNASGISLARLLDLLKLSFAVVAGVGGVIALVVAYRKQKVTEAAEHRQQAAEQRADEAHQREATKLFNERFATAAGMLGHDAPAVRLAGVQALAGLADDAPTRELRQMLIDVLCAYLRLPYKPDPGESGDADERLLFAGLREVRHTIIRIITSHLRDGAASSWQGYDFDFTGVIFDGGNFDGARFSGGAVSFHSAKFSGGEVYFGDATFSGSDVSFSSATFSGSDVSFSSATFSGGEVYFAGATFSGGEVSFSGATFSGGRVYFGGAKFSGGNVIFHLAKFSGGKVYFDYAKISGGAVNFHSATFSGGAVNFHSAKFSGGNVIFHSATFSGGEVSFGGATFPGGDVYFDQAEFSGGDISFHSATFSGGEVSFGGARFSDGNVYFHHARFSGGLVNFLGAVDWSCPPVLPDPVPAEVLLPKKNPGR
ncbi:pentapeptide repeat-containing protein [Nonomuraea sp. NPDC003214]